MRPAEVELAVLLNQVCPCRQLKLTLCKSARVGSIQMVKIQCYRIKPQLVEEKVDRAVVAQVRMVAQVVAEPKIKPRVVRLRRAKVSPVEDLRRQAWEPVVVVQVRPETPMALALVATEEPLQSRERA